MFEFNPDGSLKPSAADKKIKEEKENKLKNERCILVRKDAVNTYPPKKCMLRIKVSEAVKDCSFIEKIYSYFKQKAETQTNIKKINEKEYEIEIGTSFRRCSECASMISNLREQMFGNIIEDEGTCTSKKKEARFCYEDYFE